MFRSGFSWVSNGMAGLLLLALPALSADEAGVDRIKARVNGYFSALHSMQFEKAREFILPRAREAMGAARPGKARMTGFSIVGVKLEEGGGSAVVEVKRGIMAAVAAVGGRLELKERSRWKLEAGEWFLDPSDPPKTDAEIFREYYYDKLAARADPKPGERPPPLEVEFEETTFDFGLVVQGAPVRPRFSFRNLAAQDIIVEKIHGPAWLIKDITEKRRIPAGATGEIMVELNTAKLYRRVGQDIFVQFEPIREIVKLRVRGRVHTAEEIEKSR